MPGDIHDVHPFADPDGVRDPVRRFRGRLSAPVTIVTAYGGEVPIGVTVSSLIVSGDGEDGAVHFVLGTESSLWDAIQESRCFVVHVVDDSQRALADEFAGIRPSPGGPFRGKDLLETDHGPVLTECATRAGCALDGVVDRGDHLLVSGRIDAVELHDLEHPLQWFRGRYRTLTE